MKKRIIITGHAGFIGFHVASRLLKEGHTVLGIDNLNDYYSVKLKEDRLNNLKQIESGNLTSIIKDISAPDIKEVYSQFKPDYIINLAAQAGVRYSLIDPYTYLESNIKGFLQILEFAKEAKVKKIIYASTSSTYGGNTKIPFSEDDRTDNQLQFYAVTKKTNELMANAYSNLYSLNTIGLRFFTVYGPWGRPDMALYKFVENIQNHKPIDIYNFGKHARDFTYIDDIVDGILLVLGDTKNDAENKIFNIGNGTKIPLMEYIESIENALGIKAKKNYLPLQPGDVFETSADISKLKDTYGYNPKTNVKSGVEKFVKWYVDYHKA